MGRPKKHSDQELMEDLKTVEKEIEGNLTFNKYRSYGNYSARTIQRRFGSWNNAKEKAGLDISRAGSERKYSDKKIKEKLKEGKTLTEVAEDLDSHLTYISKRVKDSDFKILNTFTETANENNLLISLTKTDLINAGFDPSDSNVYFEKEINSDKGEITLKLRDNRVVEDEANSESSLNKSRDIDNKNGEED